MKLQINGESREFNGPLRLFALVEILGLKPDRVAVELNGSIVGREQWPATDLREGDRLEMVQFVGGGSPGTSRLSGWDSGWKLLPARWLTSTGAAVTLLVNILFLIGS
jgi:sulfur carrier protein